MYVVEDSIGGVDGILFRFCWALAPISHNILADIILEYVLSIEKKPFHCIVHVFSDLYEVECVIYP